MKIIKTFGFLLLLPLLANCNKKTDDAASDPLTALKNSTLKQLVFVKGGTFKMGDVGYTDKNGEFHHFTNDANVHPVHDVTLTSYSIQAYETTFKDFDFYMTTIGGEIIGKNKRHRPHAKPNYPALWMTWDQARDYCLWLGDQIGYAMDLPTEAQWEYAARSRGKAVAHATDTGDIEYGVNYRDPSSGFHTMPVGSWPPNPLGLYDMTGNVSEWTRDLWHLYDDKPLVDPVYDDEEMREWIGERSRRGANIIGGKGTIQLYRRSSRKPTSTGSGSGIRCVANHASPIKAVRTTP